MKEYKMTKDMTIGEKCVAHEDKGQSITTRRWSIGEKGEKCVAHEDKGRPITTWRRPIGEKVRRSV